MYAERAANMWNIDVDKKYKVGQLMIPHPKKPQIPSWMQNIVDQQARNKKSLSVFSLLSNMILN